MYGLTPFERKSMDLFNAFHDFENDFFNGSGAVSSFNEFKTDIRDEGDRYVMEAELPGFEREDIKLDLNGDTLTLSAEHSSETEDKSDKSYIRRERSFGSYRRTFDMSDVDTSRIDAEYKNGILYMNLPKKQSTAPTSRRLEIK